MIPSMNIGRYLTNCGTTHCRDSGLRHAMTVNINPGRYDRAMTINTNPVNRIASSVNSLILIFNT